MRRLLLLLMLAPTGISDLIQEVADSGRVLSLAESPSDRVQPPLLLAPGSPPLLSFRNIDATERGLLTQSGLMIDDAGH
jgi:hypothetical protein